MDPSRPWKLLGSPRMRLEDGAHWAFFLPGGERVVAGGSGPGIHLFEFATRRRLLSWDTGTTGLFGADLHPDGRRLAFGTHDHTVRVWDLEAGEELLRIEGHTRTPGDCRFTANGKVLVSASGDGTVRFWNADTGRKAASLKRIGRGDVQVARVHALALGGENHRVAALWYRGGVAWDRVAGRELLRFDGLYYHGGRGQSDLCFTDGGRRLWVAFRSQPCLCVYDLERGGDEPLVSLERYPTVHGLALSPDGTAMALGLSREVCLLDTRDFRELRRWPAPRGDFQTSQPVSPGGFSPDGTRLLTLDPAGGIHVHDVALGARDELGPGHDHGVVRIRFCEDGEQLETDGADGARRGWRLADGGHLHSVELGRRPGSRPPAGTPDGALTAHPEPDGALVVRDADGEERLRLPGHPPETRRVAFLPDGRLLASVGMDGRLRIWSLLDGRDLLDLDVGEAVRRHWDACALAASPRGDLLALAMADGEVELVELTRTRERELDEGVRPARRVRVRLHEHWVSDVAFSPDGRLLASACRLDPQARVFRVDELLGHA